MQCFRQVHAVATVKNRQLQTLLNCAFQGMAEVFYGNVVPQVKANLTRSAASSGIAMARKDQHLRLVIAQGIKKLLRSRSIQQLHIRQPRLAQLLKGLMIGIQV